MKLDFTTVKYKDFLIYLKKSNIPVFTIKDWITKQPKNGIILRHDVDRNPNQAIKIAEIASELNIKGTFNFRVLNNKTNDTENLVKSFFEKVDTLKKFHTLDMKLVITTKTNL